MPNTLQLLLRQANYRQNMNNNFEWLWENTLAYDKTFGNHAINFVAGVSAQKNTNYLNGRRWYSA